MPLLHKFETIPQLYDYLVHQYAKSTTKPAIMHKPADRFLAVGYADMAEAIETFAAGLHSLGVKRHDKVAIVAENRYEWVVSDFAILGLGAVDVPIYPSSTADTVEFILNDSDSVGVIVSNKFQLNKLMKVRKCLKGIKFIIVMNDKDAEDNEQEALAFSDVQQMGKDLRREQGFNFRSHYDIINKDDLCTIIYTSGTTGVPKGVMLTHWNIANNVHDALRVLDCGKTDTFLSFLPLCHIFERMAGYYTAFASGAMIAYAKSIETVAADLEEIKPTVMTAVPRLFERIYGKIIKNVDKQPAQKRKIFEWAVETGYAYMEAKRKEKLTLDLKVKYPLADKLALSKIRARTGGRMRYFVSGGAALPRELGEFFEACGIVILEGYGMTESSPVIAVNRLESYKFGTVGPPMPSVEVKIASDGEILVKGPNVMQGYYKNKKETEAALRGGWLHTGDIGVFDAEGYLMITDRKKHLFKTSGGKYIAPAPIENLFLSSKYIDQFVLIGDRRMFLSALIVPDFEAVKEYADSRNIPYKDEDELSRRQEIYELFDKELVKFQKDLANFEKIRKYALLDQPFSLENGEMTPSLKIRRKVVEERYKDLIEGMYEK